MITVGIDEVGRGSWAGPVVAGAVILSSEIKGLNDSKLLSKKQRDELDSIIRANITAIGIGWVEPAVVDEIGINKAVGLAMQRALEMIAATYDEVIIDGDINYLSESPKSRAIIRADATVPAVSAASIVAKVVRDNYMTELSLKYPGYGFEKHVGYGTALHIEKLKLHGVSDQHRLSYKPIKALLKVTK